MRKTSYRFAGWRLSVAISFLLLLLSLLISPQVRAQGNGGRLPKNKINPSGLSQGSQAWWFGAQMTGMPFHRLPRTAFGTNVDAANINEDTAGGQSETAIAAAASRVLAAWNDGSGFFSPANTLLGSLTGVGYSANGGHSFTDLVGLPNSNGNQQWFGDPTVVAVDNGNTFIVGSIYNPSLTFNCANGPALLTIAVSVGTVTGNTVAFTQPIIAASGGDLCSTATALLDKDFMTYDQKTRTLAISYTRFLFFPAFGTGQIEVVKAQVPSTPSSLTSADFSAPIVVWPEEPVDENEGAYPVAAFNSSAGADDIYVAWERNWFTNQFDGDPLIYIHAACIEADGTIIGGPSDPVVVTSGQLNSNALGGVKSLDLEIIPGYSRGTGNDFPRIAFDAVTQKILIEWNDASHHPLGDIFLRAFPVHLGPPAGIAKVNDDKTGALHMFPAVCVRDNGDIVSSWYDRREFPADSFNTDLFGEIRHSATSNATDFEITSGATNWGATGSIINPNFGDYTDNTCTASGKLVRTYFTWSDGRVGVSQPFVDHR